MTLALGLFDDYTLRVIVLGAIALGVVSGALGTFAVLRREALVGDAVAHAALPGVVLSYVVLGTKESLWLMIGAALAGFAAIALVSAVVRTTRVKNDAALGLWLAVFFGGGLVLLTWIQGRPDASQAGLDRFLFGQAATVLERDVWTIAVVALVALAVLGLVWKEAKLLSFDPDFGATLGIPVRVIEWILTALLVVAIVVGLQMVGAVLMSAMIVAPAAAARQWTNRLGVMTAVAAAIGALSGSLGAIISSRVSNLPTGPTIVLVATAAVVASLLFAPRGLVVRRIRARRARAGLAGHALLGDLLALERLHGGPHPHEVATISAVSEADATAALRELAAQGFVSEDGHGRWALTETGRAEAARR